MALHLEAGAEPIAGYTLVGLLGRGGFGEVWEATAPGSIRVALKFIRLDTHPGGFGAAGARDHPQYPPSPPARRPVRPRVEDCLVIAMPLCDQSLMDRLRACQAAGSARPAARRAARLHEDLARAVDFLNEPRHLRPTGSAWSGSSIATSSRTTSSSSAARCGWPISGWRRSSRPAAPPTRGAMSPHYVRARGDRRPRLATVRPVFAGRHLLSSSAPDGSPSRASAINQVLYAHLNTAPDLSVLPEKERQVVLRGPGEEAPRIAGRPAAHLRARPQRGGARRRRPPPATRPRFDSGDTSQVAEVRGPDDRRRAWISTRCSPSGPSAVPATPRAGIAGAGAGSGTPAWQDWQQASPDCCSACLSLIRPIRGREADS